MSTLKTYNLDTGDTTNLAIKTNGTTALTVNGSTQVITGAAGNIQLISDTAKASTSGTSIDFTGIPSWVKRITVMLNGVSTNGTSRVALQVGTSSGIVTSGYDSEAATFGNSANTTSGRITATTYFICDTAFTTSATDTRTGCVTLNRLDGNTWLFFGSAAYVALNKGVITLSAPLDRVRVTTANGTDTFDAGTINILYE